MADFDRRRDAVDQSHGDGMSLTDLLLELASQKKLVLGVPAVAAIVAAIVTFAMPKWYLASTKLLPPQQSSSTALMMLGQLGPLGEMAGPALNLKNPSDLHIAILKSRTIADRLIDRFDLRKVYDEEILSYARKRLASHSTFSASREGVITIDVEDKDPRRASDIANGYVEELRELTHKLAISEASRRRLFFEGQLQKVRHDLVGAEVALEKFSRQAGVVSPQGQISLSVAAAANLRAQIAAKEIQLAAMGTFATTNNPDVRRTAQELSALRTELAKMERSDKATEGDVMVPFGKAPGVGLEFTRLYRDLKYNETLLEVLSKQYEMAKIDEARDAPLVQVLDTAIVPDVKSRPRRLVTVTVVSVTVGLLAVLIAVARGRLRLALQEPYHAERFKRLALLMSARRKV